MLTNRPFNIFSQRFGREVKDIQQLFSPSLAPRYSLKLSRTFPSGDIASSEMLSPSTDTFMK